MVDKASLDKINNDPQKKAQFLKDLEDVFSKHGVQSTKLQDQIKAGATAKINAAASTVAITITS